MKIKKKIALLGIGYWGKIHLKYIEEIKQLKLSHIIFKKNNDNVKKYLKYKLIKSAQLNEIINDDTIEYVDIVTPIKTHTRTLLKFIHNKKKILVEKPLLLSIKEEKIISKYIKNTKGNIIVSYPYKYSQTLSYAKKIYKQKKFGGFQYIEIVLQQCGRFLDYDVNTLLGPHAISIISKFQDLKKIKFENFNIIKDESKTETSLILCKINKKIIGKIDLSLNYSNKNSIKLIKIFCEKGTIKCDLNSGVNTLESYMFKKKEDKAMMKKDVFKFFDETNNMRYVIKDFIKNSKKIQKHIMN